MTWSIRKRAVSCLAALSCVALFCGGDWRQFRGNQSNSVATDEDVAVDWSQGDPIAWKADLPGRGPSSPIVVGEQVIVTCSSGAGQDRLHVLSFRAADGQRQWERQFWATGRTITHPQAANATPTPASDGRRIVAFYSSNDLVCLDMDGNLLWLRGLAFDHPRVGNDAGMSSSPLVVGETAIVQVENQGDSFAEGIDLVSGQTHWHIARAPEASWASPILMPGDAKRSAAVLLQSTAQLTAHDPATGRQLWAYKDRCAGIPSAVASGDVVYLPTDGMVALVPGTSGDEPTVAWKEPAIQPGAASPVVHAGKLYAISRAGVLLCADVTNGQVLSKLRLEGSIWATPAIAGKRLYAASQEGVVQVVQLADDGQPQSVIGRLALQESILGSPVVAHGALYVRSDQHLWRIGR